MPFTNPKTHAMGGKAKAAKLTPEERRASALRAITMRWDKVRKERAEKEAA